MGIRTAFQQTRWITIGALAVAIWTVVVWFEVLGLIEWTAMDYVGRSAVGGVIGLIVLGALVVLLVALFGELGEEEPAPESWPPT
ncbi:hypothetical protein [Halopenitus sp. POP-27]|uniref:hypothetical protein n=1 Tax=Halopenitus sp. POP-27 TaxID=2994425 RepID=UPI002469A66B|nr:hypothetical protein [Halopenitus sp. POP-27]